MNQENALALLRPRLLRFAMLRLGNRDLAEDAVQETLLAAIEGIERYAGMDAEEVCRELTISLPNCRVTLHRARKRLRECPDIRGLAADAV